MGAFQTSNDFFQYCKEYEAKFTDQIRRSAQIYPYKLDHKINHRPRGFCVICQQFCEGGDPPVCEDSMCQVEWNQQAHPEDYVNTEDEDK